MAQSVHDQQNYNLILESTPKVLDLTNSSIRGFQKIFFTDSLFAFFPVVDLFIKDAEGVIPDVVNFIEGLDTIIKFGNPDTGFIGGDFVWTRNDFNQTIIADNLSGSNGFLFSSKLIKYNQPKSRSWNNTISNVVDDILVNDYNMNDSTKKFISQTTGTDLWYQSMTKNSTWIQDLADTAFSNSHNKSPFYTFFNLLGEFYFMNLYDLFTQQPINSTPYSIEVKENMMTDPYIVQSYDIQYCGTTTNFKTYEIDSYYIDETGTYVKKTHELKNHVYAETNEKLTIKKDFVNINDIIYLGNYESLNDEYNYQGIINSKYRDSALSYRMNITIPFNPKAVSGKIIDLKVGSIFESRKICKEFSGKWLILKSIHFDDKNALPYSKLLIAKSSMYIDSDHKLYNEFIL
jgi:hypothetical protein